MRSCFTLTALFLCSFSIFKFNAVACGYDWVGACSSAVHLRINGSLDSFSIADCPSGIRFNGLHLGTLQTLSLANAKAITWESCQNNVSGVGLKYRVYEQGGVAGPFLTLALDQDFFTLVGNYTTRYRSKASNIDLAAGLMSGATYRLEVYFLAEVDTIGDDFIPETTFSNDNGGQYFSLTFQYGGQDAAPFVVVPTKVMLPTCFGDSNGVVGVSVWGDQTGLFYQWSNIALNFYQQGGLPAGTYTVTVTGDAHTDSVTVVLGQPDDPANLLSGLPSEILVTCNAPFVSLCAAVTPAANYQWSKDGLLATQNPCLTASAGGVYTLVVSVGGCEASKSIVSTEHLVPQPASFFGRDTLTCAGFGDTPVLFRAITDAESPSFVWTHEGEVISTADSCWVPAQQAWGVVLPELVVTDIYGCSTEAMGDLLVILNTLVPSLILQPTDASGPGTPDGSVTAIVSAMWPYEIIWSNGVTGTNIENLLPGIYCATVTGANQCSSSSCVVVGSTVGVQEPVATGGILVFPNPATPGSTVDIALPEFLAGQSCWLDLIDSQSRIVQTVQISHAKIARLQLPNSLADGVYVVRVRSGHGQAFGRITIHK